MCMHQGVMHSCVQDAYLPVSAYKLLEDCSTILEPNQARCIFQQLDIGRVRLTQDRRILHLLILSRKQVHKPQRGIHICTQACNHMRKRKPLTP